MKRKQGSNDNHGRWLSHRTVVVGELLAKPAHYGRFCLLKARIRDRKLNPNEETLRERGEMNRK